MDLPDQARGAAWPQDPVESMKAGNKSVGVRLRIVIEPGIAIGPGKADLLSGIREFGSISAAGRSMGMSYKRAWQLVGALNGHFGAPLVTAEKGGRAGGRARLTPLGDEVLDTFRKMEKRTATAVAPLLRSLRRNVRSI